MRVRTRGVGSVGGLRCGAAASLVMVVVFLFGWPCGAGAQTLARKGWAGSGMTVERWWQGAVLYAVRPGAAPADGAGTLLEEVTARLDDLQALGIDAILLREVEAAGPAATGAVSPGAAAPLSAAYGSVAQFDALLSEASRRRLRVLVEVSGTGDALTSRARFWLSRGVTGLYLRSEPGAGAAVAARTEVRALRGVLRGFVGERVLLGDAAAFAASPMAAPDAAPAAGLMAGRRGRRAGLVAHRVEADAVDAPDLLVRPLGGLGGAGGAGLDLGVLRGTIEGLARGGAGGARRGPAAATEIAGTEAPASLAEARAQVTVLLSVRGGVALRAQDVGAMAGGGDGSPPAGKPADVPAVGAPPAAPAADPLFAWTSRMIGLHRGNATMRDGVQTLVNHDADGALVMVWRGGGARAQVLVEIVNLTAKPLALSLTDDLAGLRLRGSFLRTVLRSDDGMGAMPLRAVRLPAYGVYLGELGR